MEVQPPGVFPDADGEKQLGEEQPDDVGETDAEAESEGSLVEAATADPLLEDDVCMSWFRL